jgi:hypothetical protein
MTKKNEEKKIFSSFDGFSSRSSSSSIDKNVLSAQASQKALVRSRAPSKPKTNPTCQGSEDIKDDSYHAPFLQFQPRIITGKERKRQGNSEKKTTDKEWTMV